MPILTKRQRYYSDFAYFMQNIRCLFAIMKYSEFILAIVCGGYRNWFVR